MSLESNVVSLYRQAYQCTASVDSSNAFNVQKCCTKLLEAGKTLKTQFPTLAPILKNVEQLQREDTFLSYAKGSFLEAELNFARSITNDEERYLRYAQLYEIHLVSLRSIPKASVQLITGGLEPLSELLAENQPDAAQNLIDRFSHLDAYYLDKMRIHLAKVEIRVRHNIPKAIQLFTQCGLPQAQMFLKHLPDAGEAFKIISKMEDPSHVMPEFMHTLMSKDGVAGLLHQYFCEDNKEVLGSILVEVGDSEGVSAFFECYRLGLHASYTKELINNGELDHAFESANAVADILERNRLFVSIAEKFKYTNVDKAIVVAQQIRDREQSRSVCSILMHYAKADPVRALALTVHINDEKIRKYTYFGILSLLPQFREELQSAIEFVKEMEKENYTQWLWNICENLCAHDPDSAAALLIEYGAGAPSLSVQVYLGGFAGMLVREAHREDLAQQVAALVTHSLSRKQAEINIKGERSSYNFAEFIVDAQEAPTYLSRRYLSLTCNPEDAFEIVDRYNRVNREDFSLYKTACCIATRTLTMSQTLDLIHASKLWKGDDTIYRNYRYESKVIDSRPLNNVAEGIELLPKLGDVLSKVSVYLKMIDAYKLIYASSANS
jgi:hypothetical protein